MCFKNISALFIISFSLSDFVFAQQDSVKKDSTRLYENIESFSKRSKFTGLIYRLVFKPVAPISKKRVLRTDFYKKLIEKPYNAFEGKTIRNINIITLDPFGYSTTDTAVRVQNFINRAGNGIHVKTQSSTIRNLLLFHKNEPFSSLLVKESERLIRNQKYVYEVSFYVVAAGVKSDSADIFIREIDKWSIIPAGSLSTSKISAGLTDINFLGSGHEFQNTFTRNYSKGINFFNTNYAIPNIRNTYISTNLHLFYDGYKNFTRSLAVERPFYSPVTKWAGGVFVASQFKRDTLKVLDFNDIPIDLKFNIQDYWAGKAKQIFKESTEEEYITSLILAVRYQRIRYSEKPSVTIDPLLIYSNEDFYSASLGISTQKFIQDKFIFKYGVTEDVPVGKVYGLTGGYQVKNNAGRLYLGLRFSSGNYNTWGYLSSNFEYGTFFKSSVAEQGVFKAEINYFTELFEIGRWKLRQFVKPQMTIGINRFSYDSLTINDGYGLDGFKSPELSGTNRLLLTLQTQSYAPYKIIGFRFGPYLLCSFGMLGDEKTGFINNKVYSQIGLGVLIKNENLISDRFQISISFYPSIPGIGQNVFKMNAFRTTDFGFRTFETGKPATMIYH